MAARFDGSADVLSRSASGLGSTSFTMCGWVYIDTDRNDWTYWLGADNGSAYHLVGFKSDGTTAHISTTTEVSSATSFTVGTWYFVGAVYVAGTNNSHIYWAAAGAGSLSTVAGTLSNGIDNAWTFRVGNDGFAEFLNGRVAYARVWTAALTSTELAAERASTTAVRTTNLWADWPLASNGNDASGNGRNLTAAGTVTYVAQPPVALTVANTAQAQASANVTLTVGTALTVANSAQAQASGAPTLTQHHVLTVANSAQAQASGNVTLPVDGKFPTSAATRHLLDQHGNPWLAVGDTAWGIVGSLTDAEITTYLDNRAAKGINLILFSAPEPYYTPTANPNNVDGVYPFTGTAFQSTLNSTYWARVDLLVSLAEDRGITCLICPFYLGYVDSATGSDADALDGWGAEVVAASNAQMRTYAGYLHARYGSAPNVMWLIGHDRVPGTQCLARGAAFVDELRNILGNTQLLGYGGNHYTDVGGTDTFGYGSQDWSTTATTHPPDFDTQYDYSEHVAVNAYTMWANTPTLPFLFFEGKYESEQSIPVGGTLLREQMWAAQMAGAFGAIFGNNPIWNFENQPLYGFTGTWQSNMDAAGSDFLEAFGSIAATLDWAGTNADTGSTFVTTQGTGTNRVAARFGPDGGLVYHPSFTAGTITLDLTEFATGWSTVKVTRYDPVSGATSVVDASEATTNSAFAISAPGTNSDGDNDWLFVVEGLTAASVSLTVANSGQAQASGSPTLTQHNVLAVAASGQAQASGSPSLTQHFVLTVASSGQAQASDNPSLTQHNVLAAAGSAQAQASAGPSLTEHAVLTAASSAQAQASATVTLTQHNVLTASGSAQTQASEQPTLAVAGVLGVQSSGQAQSSTTPALTQHYTISVANTAQTQASETPTLSVPTSALTVQSSSQTQASGTAVLEQHGALLVANSTQAQTSTTVTLGTGAIVVAAFGPPSVSSPVLGRPSVSAPVLGTPEVTP